MGRIISEFIHSIIARFFLLKYPYIIRRVLYILNDSE